MARHTRRWRPRDGVNLAGYFLAESGVGEHARTMLAVLDEARIPVAPVLFRETRSRQAATLPHVEWMEPIFPVSLVCVNADQTPFFFERHPEVRENRHTIGYWHWEVEEFPDAMAASADLVDEVWTASAHSAAAISRKIDRPVHVVPPAVDPPAPTPPPAGLLPPGDGLLYLCCFDFDSVVARKNPQGAIDAFRRAFPAPRDGHRLLVKSVNGDLHPEARAELERAADRRPDIRFVDGFLTRPEQAGLIAACDVFLSLHRAEGFGLMLAEAMAAGKLVIATDYSGSREFMDESTGLLVPWTHSEIPAGCGPYSGQWAEPDLDVATESILRLTRDARAKRRLSRRARKTIRSGHSVRARRSLVRKRLERSSGELELGSHPPSTWGGPGPISSARETSPIDNLRSQARTRKRQRSGSRGSS